LQATGHTEMSKGNSFILRDKDTYVKWGDCKSDTCNHRTKHRRETSPSIDL
jgi:hypothetical protein